MVAVIIIILICKAAKSRNKQSQLINELSRYRVSSVIWTQCNKMNIIACSDYEREYQVHIYEAVHSPNLQAVNHLSSPYTEIPRGRRVQYSSIRFDNKKQATPANVHKSAVRALSNEDENGYLRLM